MGGRAGTLSLVSDETFSLFFDMLTTTASLVSSEINNTYMKPSYVESKKKGQIGKSLKTYVYESSGARAQVNAHNEET